jgi:hypothetical protein
MCGLAVPAARERVDGDWTAARTPVELDQHAPVTHDVMTRHPER